MVYLHSYLPYIPVGDANATDTYIYIYVALCHVQYLCINTSMHMIIKPGKGYTYLYTVSATCDIIIFFMQVRNFKCVKFVIPYSIRYQMKKLYSYIKISYVHSYLFIDW